MAQMVVDANPKIDRVRVALGVLDAEIDLEIVAVCELYGGTAPHAIVVSGT